MKRSEKNYYYLRIIIIIIIFIFNQKLKYIMNYEITIQIQKLFLIVVK